MKRLLLGTMLLAVASVVPLPTMAQVDMNVDIGLPPPVEFQGEPDMIPLPNTNNVYAVPGIDIDLFFWNGWWWRLWQGNWYRSQYYDQGWGYYGYVPTFYYDIEPGWREYQDDHAWYGNQRRYESFDQQRPQARWQSRHNDRGWESEQNQGTRGYQPQQHYQGQESGQSRHSISPKRPQMLGNISNRDKPGLNSQDSNIRKEPECRKGLPLSSGNLRQRFQDTIAKTAISGKNPNVAKGSHSAAATETTISDTTANTLSVTRKNFMGWENVEDKIQSEY